MRPSQALRAHREEIRLIVEQNHARNARVFGSIVHGNDTEGSDLDLLVDSTPKTTLFDLARIQGRLESLLKVKVDVLTPKGLPEKFRDRVLAEAIPV